MLKSITLDDQSFGEIMTRVMDRLPGLAPSWTDYNAHDPGITILELLAWYKEMQQYHLNFVSDSLKRRLLALAGINPHKEQAARCLVELPPEAGYRAELTRVETENGICLELDEDSAAPVKIKSAKLSGGGESIDVTNLLAQPDIAVAPFSYGGENTRLNIALEGGAPGDMLRLWFEVSDDLAVKRNPFDDSQQRPRELEYMFSDGRAAVVTMPMRDDTHGLSQSGFIELATPTGWSGDGTLIIALTDAGCEERVRITGIVAGRCAAVQRETRARLSEHTVPPIDKAAAELRDALSASGDLFAFLRTPDGLSYVELTRGDEGVVYIDARGAADDGEPNLFIVSADALHSRDMLLPSSGLPGMSIQPELGGRRVLRDALTLICDTR
ncbi:MAG: hypothetical protein LBH17_02100, partial [Oscillospiraceae bacterium]|nr:hypothetical protein [Oscillospiraceae bacterium]